MSKRTTYRTVLQAEPQELRDRGSKFIGYAVSISTEEEVKEQIQAWKEEFRDATHVCTAFRLGVDGELYRYSDDGEPSNSAGAPIYGQIQAFDLTNVLVGVVRYYGGTKLGVGGLISAYKGAAQLVLEKAQIVEKELLRRLKMTMNYEDMPHVMSILKRNRIEIKETEMTEICTLQMAFSTDVEIDFEQMLYGQKSVELTELGVY